MNFDTVIVLNVKFTMYKNNNPYAQIHSLHFQYNHAFNKDIFKNQFNWYWSTGCIYHLSDDSVNAD